MLVTRCVCMEDRLGEESLGHLTSDTLNNFIWDVVNTTEDEICMWKAFQVCC